VGFVVDKVALGQVFSEYFFSPCQFSCHRLLQADLLSPGAGTIDQIVAGVPCKLSHPTQWNQKGTTERIALFVEEKFVTNKKQTHAKASSKPGKIQA
jgi:hypothetical protein